jgi:hypothetical protein
MMFSNWPVVSNIFTMGRIASLLLLAFLQTAGAPSQLISQNNQAAHLVEVGTHKIFLNCTGTARNLAATSL